MFECHEKLKKKKEREREREKGKIVKDEERKLEERDLTQGITKEKILHI